jgi:catechol 2,3-dioxygenase-like lactoylglutathione lyase family enzyme
MSRRLAALLTVALLALGALAALLLLRRGGDEDAALARLSAPQRPYQMAIPNPLGGPGSPEPTGEAFVIAERKGIRLIRLPRRDGSSCWGAHELRFGVWQLTTYSCETMFERFPDPKEPLRVMGPFFWDAGTQLRDYQSFQGLAADGVHSVGVIDARDRVVPIARVQRNAFWADPPADRVKALVALDADGEVIWRSEPPPPPDE